MKDAYENLPGLLTGAQKPEVIAMKFQDRHLDVRRMMSLMAVNEKEGAVPLYIEVSSKISLLPLRSLYPLCSLQNENRSNCQCSGPVGSLNY